MAYHARKNIVTDGLVFHVDAANKISSDVTDTNSIVNPTEIGTYANGSIFLNDEFHFDGIDDHIDFGDIQGFGNSDTVTMEAWIKTEVFGYIAAKQDQSGNINGWNFIVFANGDIALTLSGSGISDWMRVKSTNVNATDGNWRCCVVTYDGSSSDTGIDIFMDSVKALTSSLFDPTLSASITNTTPFTIGSRENAINSTFNGEIASLKLYNRVLTQAEIQQNYESQKHRFE